MVKTENKIEYFSVISGDSYKFKAFPKTPAVEAIPAANPTSYLLKYWEIIIELATTVVEFAE